MAVEIKEVVIRAVIDYSREADKDGPSVSEDHIASEREAIVKACVRQVLRIINRSNKR